MTRIDQYGKTLAFLLRHRPDTVGLTVDEFGYASVAELLVAVTENYFPLDMETLEQIVTTDSKGRYAFNDDKTKIRALQGHSFPVNLELVQKVPPDVLYHGTPRRNSSTIEAEGLSKMQRNHVHLTDDIYTAFNVGMRYHDKVVICVVDAKQMSLDGFEFYLSQNNVWLIEHVPSKYLLQVQIDDYSELHTLKEQVDKLLRE